MFAIVDIKGKQYKVEKGLTLEVEKLKDHKEGDKVTVDKVLLKSEGDKVEVGTPYLDGASVTITVKAHGRGEKIRVFKKKAKKRYERTQGHRQSFTAVEVGDIK